MVQGWGAFALVANALKTRSFRDIPPPLREPENLAAPLLEVTGPGGPAMDALAEIRAATADPWAKHGINRPERSAAQAEPTPKKGVVDKRPVDFPEQKARSKNNPTRES